jgi:hypothetical protein
MKQINLIAKEGETSRHLPGDGTDCVHHMRSREKAVIHSLPVDMVLQGSVGFGHHAYHTPASIHFRWIECTVCGLGYLDALSRTSPQKISIRIRHGLCRASSLLSGFPCMQLAARWTRSSDPLMYAGGGWIRRKDS